jgi:hypothetical protein
VRDLFALAADYDKTDQTTQQFFATVQNLLQYEVTRQTAAEIILARANSADAHFGYANEAAYREDTRRWSNGGDLLRHPHQVCPRRVLAGQAPQHRQARLVERRQDLGALLQAFAHRNGLRHTLVRQRPVGIAQDFQYQPLAFPRREPTLAAAPFARPNRAEVVRRGEQPDHRVQMPQLRRQPLQFLVTQLRLPGQLAPLRHQCAHYV